MQTLKEIVTSILDENRDLCNDAMHGDLGDPEEFTDLSISTKCVDNYGGEDQGSDYWSVHEFSKDSEKVYVKFQGWYASHYGSEYQEYLFVEPKQKLVTVFE